jgi:hypothetical protein
MNPFSSIRSSNLFSGLGDNPLGVNTPPLRGAPAPDHPDWMTALAIQRGDENRAHLMQIADESRHRAQAKQDQSDAAQHPNTAFNPAVNGINPLQAAGLVLKQQAEQGKNDRNDASLTSRANMASAALQEKSAFGQQENSIRQQAVDIANFKAQHPNVQITAQRGGNYHIYDPAHPELGMQDTGVDTGTSTDAEKAQLGFDNNLQLIKARGNESRQTDSQRADENITAINTRGGQQRLTNAANAATKKANTVVQPSQQKTEYFNRAQQLSNDPNFSQYVKLGDKSGEFTIDPNTPQDTYHMINSRIYGNPQDIELPADDKPDNNSMGIPTTDSKYKVSIQ